MQASTDLIFSSKQSWDVFFRNANAGVPPGSAYQSPQALSGLPDRLDGVQAQVGTQPTLDKLVKDHLAVQTLIRAYQVKPNTVMDGMVND